MAVFRVEKTNTMNNAETARHIHEATHSLFKHHSQVGAL